MEIRPVRILLAPRSSRGQTFYFHVERGFFFLFLSQSSGILLSGAALAVQTAVSSRTGNSKVAKFLDR